MNYGTQEETMTDGVQSPDTNPDADFVSENLAEGMEDEELNKIGDFCKRGFETDKTSRDEWEMCLDEWIDLAKQYREEKTFPWPNASNVKYPLLSTAAMQFDTR